MGSAPKFSFLVLATMTAAEFWLTGPVVLPWFDDEVMLLTGSGE